MILKNCSLFGKTSAALLLVIGGFSAHSQEFAPGDCSVEALTNNCKEFGDPPKDRINPWDVKTDLEKLSSYAGMGGGKGGYSSGGGIHFNQNQLAESQERQVELQADFIDALSGTSKFKIALTSNMNLMTLLSLLDGDVEKTPMIKNIKMSLPWPPDVKDAKTERVEYATFKKYLDSLPPEQKKRLSEIKAEYMKDIAQAYSSFPGGQEAPGPQAQKKQEPLSDRSIKNSQIEKMRAQVNDRFSKMTERAKQIMLEELRARPLSGSPEQTERMIKKVQGIKYAPVEPLSNLCVQSSLQGYYMVRFSQGAGTSCRGSYEEQLYQNHFRL